MLPDFWGIASIATKLALYMGVLVPVGSVLVSVIMGLTINRRFVISLAILGLIATIIGFSLRGAALTGDVTGMTDPEMLGLLWSTPVGTAFALRLSGLMVVMAGLFMGRIGLLFSVIGGLITIWSFVHIGHVPDRDSIVLNFLLLFHLLAIAIWIGVLFPLQRLARDPQALAETAALGHRFGVMAAIFVPLLILAGGYTGYRLVGSVSALFGTGYGQALIIKVLLVALLLGLAAANKFRFVPRLTAGDQTAAAQLARSISMEWVVIVAILLMTAVLTSVLTLPS